MNLFPHLFQLLLQILIYSGKLYKNEKTWTKSHPSIIQRKIANI